MESVSLIKTVCRTDAAAEPPWMACFACLDQACRLHVRITQSSPHFYVIHYGLMDSRDVMHNTKKAPHKRGFAFPK
ncbi:MAG TPA: hypothetical protein ENI65_03120 [Gammaproteobacteria bacterium]|nr:hypothetical protein [Gammaproteobacteria bacterium]